MYGRDHNQRYDLEMFGNHYTEWFDSRRRIKRVKGSKRDQKPRGADILDAMDMIEILMRKHQNTWEADPNYKWKLFFPYLFIEPKPGDIIVNKTTNEEYVVAFVEELHRNQRRRNPGPIIRENSRDSFSGMVLLTPGLKEPERTDVLEFKNKDNYIQFNEWGPRYNLTHPAPPNSDTAEEQRGRFLPTVTWTIKRVEPGTIGKRPFDPAKMSTPVVWDCYADPAHTYLLQDKHDAQTQSLIKDKHEVASPLSTGDYLALDGARAMPDLSTQAIVVWGQWFDNLVQFDCYTTNNLEANKLIFWFEDFMDLYIPVLRYNGVDQILYWQRTQDQTTERYRDDIEIRKIQYYFRTLKLRIERRPVFRKYDFTIRVSNDVDKVLLKGQLTGSTTYTGTYGGDTSMYQYDTSSGVTFTGDSSYLWGNLDIQENF